MTKPKTLEQLRAEKKRAETQLAQEQHKLERLGCRQDLDLLTKVANTSVLW